MGPLKYDEISKNVSYVSIYSKRLKYYPLNSSLGTEDSLLA